MGITTGVPMFIACHDRMFEDGRWEKTWPPAPWLLMFLCRNVTYYLHSDWHKFAPSDNQSRLKPRPYAGP